MHTKPEPLIKPEKAAAWASFFPGLAWSIDVPQSRLEIIKDWQHAELGANTAHLLKDASFQRKHVMPEDHLQLVEFWEAVAAGIPASALFRLASSPREWLFLQGWPGGENNWFYHGTLQIAPEYILPETQNADGGCWSQCRSVAGYPVLLVDPENGPGSGAVVAWNQEAGVLLGRDSAKSALPFESLVPRGALSTVKRALETVQAEGVWSGALTLKLPSGMTVNSEMRLTTAFCGDKHLVRLSFLSVAGRKPLPGTRRRLEPGTPADELVRKVSRASSLKDALEVLLASHEPHAFDGILYSDIHADKGHVAVYGAGKPCADMWGQVFAYEGTIAQNIERHGLNYLVVDNTLDSIKSIDWVLFVPRGIRSYFARPFYRHGRLRAVLILCSLQPGAFSLADAERYEVLAPAFTGAVFRAKPPV